MKYRKGTICKIIGNSSDHEFGIGTKVVIEEVYVDCYRCKYKRTGDYWYVKEEDLELVKRGFFSRFFDLSTI